MADLHRCHRLFQNHLPPSIDILAEARQQFSKRAVKTPVKSTLVVKRTEISWLPSRCLLPGIVSLCHVWVLNTSAQIKEALWPEHERKHSAEWAYPGLCPCVCVFNGLCTFCGALITPMLYPNCRDPRTAVKTERTKVPVTACKHNGTLRRGFSEKNTARRPSDMIHPSPWGSLMASPTTLWLQFKRRRNVSKGTWTSPGAHSDLSLDNDEWEPTKKPSLWALTPVSMVTGPVECLLSDSFVSHHTATSHDGFWWLTVKASTGGTKTNLLWMPARVTFWRWGLENRNHVTINWTF